MTFTFHFTKLANLFLGTGIGLARAEAMVDLLVIIVLLPLGFDRMAI